VTPRALPEALALIRATPGYERIGEELSTLHARRRIRLDENTEDRAYAGLLGTITLGPEAIGASPLSLAQTLVHEQFHLHQNPLLKSPSFWIGKVTRTPVMRRYERPAYAAAAAFLQAVARAHPHLAVEATFEERAIRQVFAEDYGGSLD
jgi:hypothetical protein